jgi:protein-disulfide isomerase
MKRAMRQAFGFPFRAWLVACILLVGCSLRPREPASAGSAETAPAAATRPAEAAQVSSPLIPVSADDAVWGNPDAWVTLVGFFDAQCAFCQKVWPTILRLGEEYGPGRLRLVFKHHALPFHPLGRPAAVAAQLVLESRGPRAFVQYYGAVLGAGADPTFVRRTALEFGVDRARLQRALSDPSDPAQRKVDADTELAGRLGLTGTPSFVVNGRAIVGAHPMENFMAVIASELAAVGDLVAAGVPPSALYPSRVAANWKAKPERRDAAPQAPDSTRYQVAIAGAPAQGPRDAPVTIVEFVDLECPFCKRADTTIQEILRRYPGRVRRVVKHHPLPFHKRALPAAMLALEARAERGDAAHFDAIRRLFASAPRLEEPDLLAVAQELRLDPVRVRRALDREAYRDTIERDSAQATELDVRGTPSFFVNGVRIQGAQPLEKFLEVIETELKVAQTLVDRGVPRARVYDELMKTAKAPPPPETRSVAPPTAANPARGPAGAPIVIQIFADFECPFCRRVQETIKAVDRSFPGQIRWVWRNLPLSFHRRAREAAMAALEAYAERGSSGFWQMHDLLFSGQAEPGGLEHPALLGYATRLGLDRRRFEAALANHQHESAIQTDERDARDAAISGTPSFVVNGYLLQGAQPPGAFKRVIDYARKHPVPPVSAPAKSLPPVAPPAPSPRPRRDQALRIPWELGPV